MAYLLAIQQKKRQGGGNFKNPLIQKIMLIQKLPFHSKITGAFSSSFQSHSSLCSFNSEQNSPRDFRPGINIYY